MFSMKIQDSTNSLDEKCPRLISLEARLRAGLAVQSLVDACS